MTTQERLDEATQALHDLNTGQSVAEVTDQNGEKIRYRSVDYAKLTAYIKKLEAELAGTAQDVGPMRIWGR